MRPVDDLTATVGEILALLGPLSALLPEKPNKPRSGLRGKRQVAPAPWNGEAAGVWMEIHAGARWHELSLCVLVGLPARPRGGSDQNTIYALQKLPILVEKDGGRSAQAGHAIKDSDRWLRHTREILGLQDPTHRLPKNPGHDEPACPYCHLMTLRWRGELFSAPKVWCCNPVCRDGEGRRAVAFARRGAYTGQDSMVFQDGTLLPPGLPKRREAS